MSPCALHRNRFLDVISTDTKRGTLSGNGTQVHTGTEYEPELYYFCRGMHYSLFEYGNIHSKFELMLLLLRRPVHRIYQTLS